MPEGDVTEYELKPISFFLLSTQDKIKKPELVRKWWDV